MTSPLKKTIALTSLQKELWLAHLELPEEHPGISQGGVFELVGAAPDGSLLRKALEILVGHFPLLSATLEIGDDTFPVFRTRAFTEAEYSDFDLSDKRDPDHSAQTIIREFAEQPFTPLGGRLCRFTLLRISDDKSIMLLRFFHLAADGVVSLTHFNKLTYIYNELLNQRPLTLGTPQDWQSDVDKDKKHLASRRAKSDIDFWHKQLNDLPRESCFSPKPGRPDKIEGIERLEHDLPAATLERLQRCAKDNGTGIQDILTTLHFVTLARLYDRDHLAILLPLRFGERKNQWAIHGHLVNILPLWIKIDHTSTFKSILDQVLRKKTALARRTRTPFQLAFRNNGELANLTRLWDTNFNYIPVPANGKFDQTRVHISIPITSRHEQLILGIYAIQTGTSGLFHLSIDYSINHFSREDARNYILRLEQLLDMFLDAPQTPVKFVDISTDQEKKALASWQNGEKHNYDKISIPEFFEQNAREYADNIAITGDTSDPGNTVRLTYQQVAQRSNQIATRLIEDGIIPGDIVAVLARRHTSLPATIIGIMKAGAIYLPVDPDYPEDRIEHMLKDAAATKILLIDSTDTGKLKGKFKQEYLSEQDLSRETTSQLFPNLDPDAAAYLIYTSGSTGIAKGTLLSHASFVNMIKAQIDFFTISPRDHILQFASPSFDASLSEIFMTLMAGGELFPVSRAMIDEPWSLRDFMSENQISVVTFPPSYLKLFNRETFPKLRILITAGEAPIADDARHYAQELKYINAYGPTEAAVCATMSLFDPSASKPAGIIGRPIANTATYILDRGGIPSPPEKAGELYLAGAGLALGYLNRQELTNERFVPASFDSKLRLYKTGDRAIWTNDGEILLLGRLDDQVKIRGHRVEPGEISAILETFPDIAQAVVTLVPEMNLVAFLVAQDSNAQPAEAIQLRAKLQQKLPEYMIPSRFLWIEKIPVAATGKIDKTALIRQVQQTQENSNNELTTQHQGSQTEEEVRSIFTEILGEHVNSLTLDFFSLGGDSIRLLELGRNLNKHFDSLLTTRQLLVDASISGIAKQLQQKKSYSESMPTPSPAKENTEPLPLSQGQKQLWILDRMSGSSSQYNMPLAVEIESDATELSDEQIRAALLKALQRQPSCRVEVSGDIDHPRLTLNSAAKIDVKYLDLRLDATPERSCNKQFDAAIHKPFELTQAPLVRAMLIRIDEKRRRLLLVMHHIIGDGVSLQIILDDLFNTLNQENSKQLARIAPQRLSEFCAEEEAYLQSSEGKNDLDWWRKHLSPRPARINLSNSPRPPLKGSSGDLVRQELSPDVVAKLLQLAKSARSTRLVAFVTLLLEFLKQESGQQDIAVGLPVGLRDNPALDDVVGYFVNTAILRAPRHENNTDLTVKTKQVAENFTQAVHYGRYPFPVLATAIGDQRDPSRAPLIDILVTEIDELSTFQTISTVPTLRIKPVDISLKAAKLDFTFILHPRADQKTELVLEFDTAITSPPEAEALLDRFTNFIATALTADVTKGAISKAKETSNLCDDTATAIAAAWSRVLSVKNAEITESSNFFSLGGDSIKAIQIVGDLRRVGIDEIAPAELFSHPTFGELCQLRHSKHKAEHHSATTPAPAPTIIAGETVALLPMQHQLFTNHAEHCAIFNMVLPLKIATGITCQTVRSGIIKLSQRHASLRLSFSKNAIATLLPEPAKTIWEEFDGNFHPTLKAAVQDAATRLFTQIDLEAGPLFGAVLTQYKGDKILVLGGHHLVLDAVSLDILRRELSDFCQNGLFSTAEPEAAALVWGTLLAQQSEKIDTDELQKWLSICTAATTTLPGLIPTGVDKAAERIHVTKNAPCILSSAIAPRVELLTTLSRALNRCGINDRILVNMEGHGRENLFANIDSSHAVGWFTSTYPLLLTTTEKREKLRIELEDWFKNLSYGGLEYTIAAQTEPEKFAYHPQISFNYLGEIGADKGNSDFTPLPEMAGPGEISDLIHPEFKSAAPLDITIYQSAAEHREFVISVWFSPHCVDKQWVEELLHFWVEALNEAQLPAITLRTLAAATLSEPHDIEEVFNPTDNQQAMLFQQQLDGSDSLTYTQQINFRLTGTIDEVLLAEAWHFVSHRHVALRSLFADDDKGDSRWVVLNKGRDLVERFDLSNQPEPLRQSLLNAQLEHRRNQPFSLNHGPLFFIQLFRLNSQELEMSWCFHHILMDGWCIGIILNELFSSYVAMQRGQTPQLDSPTDINNYLKWHDNRDEQAAQAYWQNYLAQIKEKFTPILNRTGANNQAPEQQSHFTREEDEWQIDAATSQRLSEIARNNGVSTATLLQAAWGLMLNAQNNPETEEILFGLISSGRPADVEGIEKMVGLFIRTLPVRIKINPEASFGELLREIQREALERAPFEFLSLAEIQRLSPHTGTLFDHILVFENYPLDGIEQEGAPTISSVSGFEQHPYDFGLSIVPGETILFRFSSNPQRIPQQHIDLLKQRWKSLLEAIVELEKPSCATLTAQLIAQDGEKTLPAAFNATQRPYPRNKTLPEIFRDVAASTPDAIALTTDTNATSLVESWTYKKLDLLSDRIAINLGITAPGEPIALAMEREPLAIAVILGILKAGGCYLPLDTKSPTVRIAKMLQIANCRRIVLDTGAADPSAANPGTAMLIPDDAALEKISVAELVNKQPLSLALDTSATQTHTQTHSHAHILAHSPAYIMFTSGSTGEPKGVVIPHRAISRLVLNNGFLEISPADKVLQAGPLSFDASTLEIWGPLLNGAGLCFISDEALLTPGNLKEHITAHSISVMWLTSSLCNLLIDEDVDAFVPLRVLLTGGEALSVSHINKLMAYCPTLEIINGYGPTENTTFTTTHSITPADGKGSAIPIGKPIGNTRVYILRKNNSLAAIGEWGELCAAGDGLAIGYLGAKQQTAAAFVELAEPISQRVYKTGDIARLRQDGILEFQGRIDNQVKVRGYRIELTEIDNALMQLDLISQAATVVSGSDEMRQLISFITLAKEQGDQSDILISAEVQQALARLLPSYMLPDRFEIRDELPINANGKLDRNALVAIIANSTSTTATQHSSPIGDTAKLEQQVAQLYSEILEQPVTSSTADFYRLGGQSLKAMRLLARLNRRFNIKLSIREVLTHTTVAALAQRISAVRGDNIVPEATIPQLEERDTYPLSSGQERLWFLQHLQPQSSVYNVPFAVRINGTVSDSILQQTLTILEKRHDALRLRVPATIGEQGLSQSLAPPGGLILQIRKDLVGASPKTIAQQITADIAEAFDFGDEQSLIRAVLVHESPTSSVLLLVCHHLICDGLSAEILLKDLLDVYQSIAAGREAASATTGLRYVDYAAWQRNWLSNQHELRERWRARMLPLCEPLTLPTDHQRPATLSFTGKMHRFRLSPAISADLKKLAQNASTTHFAVLAGLVNLFLYRHSGQKDIVIGVPAAGRQHAELETVVGFFVNTLPLPIHLEPESGFLSLIEQLSKTWHACLEDQLYPFEALVDALDLPREASRNPLFDVLVAFEENSWTETGTMGNLDLTPYPLNQSFSKMDLSFYFREVDQQLEIDIEYATDLFNQESILRFAEHFAVLADSVLKDSALALHSLEIMSQQERSQVIDGFNQTLCNDWNLEQTIDDLFQQQLDRDATSIAIRAADGTSISFGDFNRRVELLTYNLVAHGVEPGTYVGVCFNRSPELMVVIYSVIRSGAIYVPFVPGLPQDRISSMLEDLDSPLMISAESSVAALRASGAQRVLTLKELESSQKQRQLNYADPNDSAYVIFTSGSTGRPKGTLIEHRSVINRISWMQSRFPLGSDDVILQKTTISFDVSIWELFWWSWTGATLAQLPDGGEKDPAVIVATIAASKATVLHFVPSMLQVFLHYLENEQDAIAQLATLRYIFSSGEALTPDLVERFNRLLYQTNGSELHNLYGPTEATVDVTWHPCSPLREHDIVPIGTPIANTKLYILDPYGAPCPIGVRGDLFISGIQVARGYINRPKLNAELFMTDPFTSNERMYKSGDVARFRADGVIEYLGRSDHQVKIRGYRIELGEIENALERIDMVAQAVVRVTEFGDLPALEAFLLPSNGGTLSRSVLRRALEDFLPDYMIPSLFYAVDNIPLNVSGKADRKALAGRILGSEDSHASDNGNEEHSSSHQNQITQQIQAIWRQVLPEGATFGLQENFFEVGGNSLLMIRLHELLEEYQPGHFALTDLFVAVTIKQQAQGLEAQENTDNAYQGDTTKAITTSTNEQPIAIIGMAVRLADFDELELFWSDLLAGIDRTGPLPTKRRVEVTQMLAAIGITVSEDKLREAAYLDDISGFDCKRFGLAPIDVTLMDPEQRLMLETAFRSLEDAGYGGEALNDLEIGMFVGASPSPTFKEAVNRSFADRAEQAYVLNVTSNMATRLGYIKNWHGPAEVVDTACSSTLKAVLDACRALRCGECSLAVAGGARVISAPLRGDKSFTIETSSGQTRTFDASADGVGAGEGAVAFLLKPLEQALNDGDAIRAVVRGGAINQDGRSASIAAPNPAAQAQVIKNAAQACEVELESIDFFEAHGTGTSLGDPIEIDGLTRAFSATEQLNKVAISSVKGNYGHLDATAGGLGMAKAILALENGIVPRQPHFITANPRINFHAAPVFVAAENHHLSTTSQPWRCGISAFGLSGINVHLILEQAPPQSLPLDDDRLYLIPISATSGENMRVYIDRLLSNLSAHPSTPVAAIAATLTTGRGHLPFRLAVTATSTQQLIHKLLHLRLENHFASMSKVRITDRQFDLESILDEHSAEQAKTAYLAGNVPLWPKTEAVIRLHLPPVPMQRTCCWPQFKTLTNMEQHLAAKKGFLQSPVNAPEGLLFALSLNDDNFWPLHEHRLIGRKTLVGMAVVALAAEAIAKIEDKLAIDNENKRDSLSPLCIENLTWLKPLVLDEIESSSLLIEPLGLNQERKLRLRGQDREEKWYNLATATLRIANRHKQINPPIDPIALQNELVAVTLSPPENKQMQVQISGRWDCCTQRWRSQDGERILAKLRLGDEYLDDLNNCPWHPALLDVAASLALDRFGLIPSGCRKIYLFKPLPQEFFALATKIDSSSTHMSVDCRLVNTKGETLVEFKGLNFFALGERAAQARLHPILWQQQPLTKPCDLTDQKIILIGDTALTQPLKDELARRSHLCDTNCTPENNSDFDHLITQISTKGIDSICWLLPESELYLWSLAGFLKTLLRLGIKQPLNLLVIGRGAVNLEDKDTTSPPISISPDAALANGLLLSVTQEEALLSGHYLELDGDVPLAAIIQELCVMGASGDQGEIPEPINEPIILDEEGQRFCRKLGGALVTTDDTTPLDKVLPDEGVVVISGGIGAMALTLAETIGSTNDCATNRSIALLHRSPFPTAENWSDLKESDDPILRRRILQLLRLQDAGINFQLYCCDICEQDALKHTLEQIRTHLGSICGVVHTAGIAGDGFLINKEKETFAAVLAPKVAGARNLHELTLNDKLEFFVLASSRTGLSGAVGQSDYAAANAWLDAFARWRRQMALPALSLNWNTWAEIGMAADQATETTIDHLTSTSLPPKLAGKLFLQALSLDVSQLVITMTGEKLPGENSQTTDKSPSTAADSTDSKKLSFPQQIMQIWAEGLGYETQLDLNDDFYALGGDSITGMQIINQINQDLGQNLGLADLFSHSMLGDFIAQADASPAEIDPDTNSKLSQFMAPFQDNYPVSSEQLAVLQAEASTLPHSGYNLPQFMRLPQDVDPNRLEQALQQLIARHEILRTGFLDIETPAPRMKIVPELEFSLICERVADFTLQACQALITPFNLERAPLFRARLLEDDEAEKVLFFDIHHAVADARTIDLLFADMVAFYLGETLPPNGPQQKDAAWRQQQEEKDISAARAYWLGRFNDELPRLDLPADHLRPSRHTNRGASLYFSAPEEWIPRLKALASSQSTTSYTVILSLWNILLGRYTRNHDLVIAVAADSREGTVFDKTSGMFVSLLPLRLRFEEEETFSDLLQRNHLHHTDALRFRSFALNRLLTELKAPMMPERTPLSEVTFSYMNFTGAARSDSEFSMERLAIQNPAAKADLAIFVSDTPNHLGVALEYYADLFNEQRMQRMSQHFLHLLGTLLDKGAQHSINSYAMFDESKAVETAGLLPGIDNSGAVIPKSDEKPDNGKNSPPLAASVAVERQIVALFREMFKQPGINRHDSFFELGGHSLLGMQICYQLAEHFGKRLSIRELFDHPTPAELAKLLLHNNEELKRIPIVPARKDGRFPLSHAQQRLYVLHHLEGGDVAYNMPFLFSVTGDFNPDTFQKALVQLTQRHETLRTSFVNENGELLQIIHENCTPIVSIERLSENQRNEALQTIRADAATPFNLSQAPLLRCRLYIIGQKELLLSLVMHHIIGDGWSMQVMFNELSTLYNGIDNSAATNNADEINLPPLAIQYRDYAVWEQNHAWQDDAEYWKTTLAAAPTSIAFPRHAPLPEKRRSPLGVQSRRIDDEVMSALREYAVQEGVSLSTLILTLFAALLHRLTRQQDMVIGMGVAGRDRKELEGLIGFFINILPIRITMDEETELKELLRLVNQRVLDALERQNYPFDLLVREVAPVRGTQREALLNVMFEYQRFSDLNSINPAPQANNNKEQQPEYQLLDLNDVATTSTGNELQAKYDLTLFVQDEPQGCRLKAEFDSELLASEEVATWLEYLENFMQMVIAS